MANLNKHNLTEEEFLAQYEPKDYPRPSLTVDMAVFTVTGTPAGNYRKLPERELQVLLIKRGGHPYLGCWALPGGFVRPNETVGQAAKRELQEETGVADTYLEQVYTFSQPDRDPRTWVVSSAHMALVDSTSLAVHGGDDAEEAAWFCLTCNPKEGTSGQYRLTLERDDHILESVIETGGDPVDAEAYKVLRNDGLAFDHAKILLCALLKLRAKVKWSPVALHLVPELFTLTELQQVYEKIEGKPLLAAAFRRKVAALVEETDHYTKNAGHRPSRLFRKKSVLEEG